MFVAYNFVVVSERILSHEQVLEVHVCFAGVNDTVGRGELEE